MQLKQSIQEFFIGLKSLVTGLRVTGKSSVQPQRTVHYPRATVDNLTTFRGHVELIPVLGGPTRCIACRTCERVCPSQCITVITNLDRQAAEKPDVAQVSTKRLIPGDPTGAKKKMKKPQLVGFTLDFTLCSLCGLCAESCPVDALRFSDNAYLSAFGREAFNAIDLYDRAEQACSEHPIVHEPEKSGEERRTA